LDKSKVAGSEAQLTRLDTANALKLAGALHFAKKGYAVNQELGLKKKGRLRADLFCLSFKKKSAIVEVKSCWADFKSDTKWQGYLEYANQFFFLATKSVAEKIKNQVPSGVGVLYLCPTSGHVKSMSPAKNREICPKLLDSLLIRCVFRGAAYTKKTSKRKRIYLET
jgi:hypothetical protein